METESPLKKIAREMAEHEKALAKKKALKESEQRLEDAAVTTTEQEPETTWDKKDANPLADVAKAIKQARDSYARVTGAVGTLVMPQQLELVPRDSVTLTTSSGAPYTISVTTKPHNKVVDFEYKTEISGVRTHTLLLTSINNAVKEAKEKLINRVAAQNLVSEGDPWFEVEVTDDGDLFVEAHVNAHAPR